MTIVFSQDVLVVAQWMRHPALVHEVAGLPFGERKFLGVMNMCHARFMFTFPKQVLSTQTHVFYIRQKRCVLENTSLYVANTSVLRVQVQIRHYA